MPKVLGRLKNELKLLAKHRNDLVNLIQSVKGRHVCVPVHPELEKDEKLLAQQDKCIKTLSSLKNLIEEEKENLLAKSQLDQPLKLPPDLLTRIKANEQLLCLRKIGDEWRFLAEIQMCSNVLKLPDNITLLIKKLSNTEKTGILNAASNHANEQAYFNTTHWHKLYDEFIKENNDNLLRIYKFFVQKQKEAESERKNLKDQHDEILLNSIKDFLEVKFSNLANAELIQAENITSGIILLGKRESSALVAVKKIWEEALKVEQWANRLAEPLNENDQKLAKDWAKGHEEGGYWLDAMGSARCAELVALKLYRETYTNVEDLSILQAITPSDTRWMIADIAGDGRLIDVKNARRSFSAPDSYSEHTVKKFKVDPIGTDVIISGFLSEYQKAFPCYFGEVVWLGETTKKTITALQAKFNSEYLQVNLFNKLVPPWLFEFPIFCYSHRDFALGQVDSPEFVLPKGNFPIGLLLLTGHIAPTQTKDTLAQEIQMLDQLLKKNERKPTRPLLFLHVLDRFCLSIRKQELFPSSALMKILYSNDLFNIPLGVFDPLNIVKELIDVLEKVSKHCRENTMRFSQFKLAGPSILQGQNNDGKWETIYAYCGGWGKLQDTQIKCGQNPLFLGQNKPCDLCGKLICHKCGFCTKICNACAPRQKNHTLNYKKLSPNSKVIWDIF